MPNSSRVRLTEQECSTFGIPDARLGLLFMAADVERILTVRLAEQDAALSQAFAAMSPQQRRAAINVPRSQQRTSPAGEDR